MPRMCQIEWWLEKEPNKEKATELWKQHHQSIVQKNIERTNRKFESSTTYGDWEVIQPVKYEVRPTPKGQSRTYVHVRCKCGKEDTIQRGNLMSGRSKSCRGCYHRGNLNNRWSGHEDMPGSVFHKIRGSAKNRDIPFNVTKKELRDLLHKQNFKCALSGQELTWDSASLDRIDSNLPYEIGNLQWVLSEVNYMKRILTQDRFIELCKLITENNS